MKICLIILYPLSTRQNSRLCCESYFRFRCSQCRRTPYTPQVWPRSTNGVQHCHMFQRTMVRSNPPRGSCVLFRTHWSRMRNNLPDSQSYSSCPRSLRIRMACIRQLYCPSSNANRQKSTDPSL